MTTTNVEQTSKPAVTQTTPAITRFMGFRLDQEDYALPLLVVKEVIALPEFTPVPKTPRYFLGVMNLRGQIISVVDLRLKLGLKADRTEHTCVIICDLGTIVLGVVVSSVTNVIALTPNQIGEPPEISAGGTFVSGVAKLEKHMVLIIDIASALGVEPAGAENKKRSESNEEAAA
jgi:purine-binding chemotaxis protein CheW